MIIKTFTEDYYFIFHNKYIFILEFIFLFLQDRPEKIFVHHTGEEDDTF